jgi:hypothetical protein
LWSYNNKLSMTNINTFQGKVGIGTNAPNSSSLHVFKATGASISVESSAAGTYGSLELGGPQGAFLDFKSPFSDDNDARLIYNVDTGPNGQLDITGSNVAIDSFTLFVNSVGNKVGIGTDNPGAQLQIGPVDNHHLFLASSNNTYGWILDTDDQGSGAVPFRIKRRVSGTDTVALAISNQNGFVGIGTTLPLNDLHVFRAAGDATNGLFIEKQNSGSGTATLLFGVAADGDGAEGKAKAGIFFERMTSNGRGDLHFCTDNSSDNNAVGLADTRMTITQAGTVGIGTDNPKQPLEVKTDAVVSGRLGVGNVLTSAQNNNGQNIWSHGTAAKLVVRCLNNSDTTASYANARAYAGIAIVPGFDAADTTNMGLWGSGSGENPRFYIQNQVNNGGNGGGIVLLQPVAGSVGIGVFSPAHLLDVAGYIGCTGLDMAGTQIRTTSNQVITAGTYVQVATYRTLSNASTYLITVSWNGYGGGSAGGTQQLWQGGASWVSSALGGANTIYAPWESAQAVVATHSYHYRSIAAFSIRERGTGGVTGSYMDHGIQMTNTQSSNTVTDLKAVARWIGPWGGG